MSLALWSSLQGQDINVPILFSTPPQVEKTFTKSHFSKTHEFSSHVNPFYLNGDFNGDGKLDTAVLIKEKSSGKIGIAIFHGKSKKVFVIGAGSKFGNDNAEGNDNFAWLDSWYVYLRALVGRGVEECRPPKLLGDAILAQKSESASGLIYWNGKKYSWYQQGD